MIEIKTYLSTKLFSLVDKWRQWNSLPTRGHSPRTSGPLLPRWLGALMGPHCYLCDVPVQLPQKLCQACQGDLSLNLYCCQICALPFDHPEEHIVCGTCLQHSPPYDHLIAPLIYTFPVDAMIKAAKYQGKLYYLNALLAQIIDQLEPNRAVDLLVPIPMHWRKKMQRGENHVATMASTLGKQLAIPVGKHILRKTQATAPQASLKKTERLKNLRGTFTVTRDLTGMNVALIDDVVTTGATIETASKALKARGAASVVVWAIARTPRTKHPNSAA